MCILLTPEQGCEFDRYDFLPHVQRHIHDFHSIVAYTFDKYEHMRAQTYENAVGKCRKKRVATQEAWLCLHANKSDNDDSTNE